MCIYIYIYIYILFQSKHIFKILTADGKSLRKSFYLSDIYKIIVVNVFYALNSLINVVKHYDKVFTTILLCEDLA